MTRRRRLRRLLRPAATASSPRPAPAARPQVKVFAFPLMKPIGGRSAAARRRPGRTAGEHRLVHAVRRGLSRRRFARDRLACRIARRRRADRRQPAGRAGTVKVYLQRLGAGRRARASTCRARSIRLTAPTSARSRASSRSTGHPARGSPPRARRPAPTCWSAALRPEARTPALSNTIWCDQTLKRRHCRPCASDKSGPEKGRKPPRSEAIRANDEIKHP